MLDGNGTHASAGAAYHLLQSRERRTSRNRIDDENRLATERVEWKVVASLLFHGTASFSGVEKAPRWVTLLLRCTRTPL